MIVWLASYQRSGCAILQTLLRQSLGYRSYARLQEGLIDGPIGGTAADYFSWWSGPWADFHAQAACNDDLYLIKTHSSPSDDLPAIHVVRDGRSAMTSHWQVLHPRDPVELTLSNSVNGAMAFQPWSHLVGQWRDARARPTLELRYEELVAGDTALLHRIAEFVGHRGAVRPWDACVRDILAVEPDFFSRRKPQWVRPPEWTDAIDAAFEARHGWMMDELGYFADRPGRRARYAAKRALRSVGIKRRERHAPAP